MKNNHYSKYIPEEIFEIFKERHRLASPLDPTADETFELTKETVIADLQEVQGLLPWEEWTEWLNQSFRIDVKEEEWRRIVTPITKKTLWNISFFISERAEKEEIKPIRLLGTECLTSAVFLTLKKNLSIRGADVKQLKPSTNLSAYLDDENNFSPLLEEVTLLGVKTFEELAYGNLMVENKLKYWIDKLFPNIIYRRPLLTGDLITFRDLVNRIIENNKLGAT